MRLFKPHTPPPPPSVGPSQPKPGGKSYPYKVAGIWDGEGNLLKPERLVIELENGQKSNVVGDVLHLTRLEASVLGKRVLLVPNHEEE